jgi:hypothetical protein
VPSTTAQQQVSVVVCQQQTFQRKCYFNENFAISFVHSQLILEDLELLKFKLNFWQKTSLHKAFILPYFFEYKRKGKRKFWHTLCFSSVLELIQI